MNENDLARRVVGALLTPEEDLAALIKRQPGESDSDYNERMIALADRSSQVGVIAFYMVPSRERPPEDGEPDQPIPEGQLTQVIPFLTKPLD